MANEVPIRKAFLVGTYLLPTEKESCNEHLDELAQLVKILDMQPLEKVASHLREPNSATLLSKGKLEEAVARAKELQATVVVFDDEVRPNQQRNLEKIFGIPVIDRTEVILEVFAQRARSKEAQLQIELAQLNYQASRLRRLWTHLHRQVGGGGVYLKGAGETQIEIDRRLIKRRREQLTRELEVVRKRRLTQRQARERTAIPTFAIVGYTNAGKSTLLNALTKAGVLVEDQLFATLDTTTRKFTLPNHQEVLITDTVGFIRKIPHLLVEAFKSTLEESVDADVLIHLIDASHPMALEQVEATQQVLHELKADRKPTITVLNKVDRCEKGAVARLRFRYTKVVQLSALTGEGLERLLDLMERELEQLRRVVMLRVPQSEYAVVGEMMRVGRVLSTDYEENDILLRVELPAALLPKLEKYTYNPQAVSKASL